MKLSNTKTQKCRDAKVDVLTPKSRNTVLKQIKKSGKKVPFDRDKLERSVQIALRKRPVESERVDRMISGIVRRVESLGEAEIASDVVGEIVMEGLQSIDPVAYVRFASVYKNFREAKDFEEFIGVISSNNE